MPKPHPHAEATYRVVPRADKTFGVEVAIPDAYPTTVSPFATEAEAEAWIAQHKTQIEGGAAAMRLRRKPLGPPG